MNTIKLGVIGPGLIFRNMHGNILKGMKDTFTVTSFCARTDETLNKALEFFPDAKCFKDADALLNEDIDAVLIALPVLDMGPMAIKALNKGKNVFIEKPIAGDSITAHKIVELSKETGKKVYVLENFAYKPIIRKTGELLKEGIVGDLIYCDVRNHYILDYNVSASDGYAFTSWRINPEFPLGAFMDGGIHYVSALTQMFGKPESIYASGSKIRENYGDYDHILSVFEYNNNLRVNFSQSAVLDGEADCIKVWGSEGFLSVEKDYIKVVKKGVTEEIPVHPVESHLAMWQSIAESYLKGEEPMFSADEATLNVEICEAVDKSLKQHMPVKL